MAQCVAFCCGLTFEGNLQPWETIKFSLIHAPGRRNDIWQTKTPGLQAKNPPEHSAGVELSAGENGLRKGELYLFSWANVALAVNNCRKTSTKSNSKSAETKKFSPDR